jgi:cell division protein FtsN
MNLSYNKGAINKLMVINILLIILITATVFVLLVPGDEDSAPQIVSTSPATTKPSQAISPAPANHQAEINALKKQLEGETSKLQLLRVEQQQLLEAKQRNVLELDAAIVEVDAQPAGASEAMPETAQDTVEQSVSDAPETETPPKNQAE